MQEFLDAVGVRPDPYQHRAMAAIDSRQSVIVAAPTGAGKTLVADYAVHRALARGRRAIYTAPLKALSNQKHRDLSARFGSDFVGLLTGDRSVNPGAPVVVMTTEVLRALLYDRADLVADLDAIVLDEFHYLQDPDRGPVWEEVVIEAPSDVPLVCLSATVAEVDVLGDWLRAAHGPTEIVVEEERPVALDHVYAIGNLHHAPPLLLPMFVEGRLNPVAELRDGTRRDTRGEGLRVRDRDRPVTPTRDELLSAVAADGLLPCIWFVLSRARCDRALEACVEAGLRLTSSDEARTLRSLAEEAATCLTASERRALGWTTWITGFESGIATHHGGLTPLQRELVEVAYASGLVKVAFATETLALGVNLPARTVIVDRVTRPEGHGAATISSAEFAQLAGRAGRRGIDSVGHVIVPWQPDVGFHQVAALAGGRAPELNSHYRISPALAANLLHRHGSDGARTQYGASLAQHLRRAEATLLRRELRDREAELATLPPDADEPSAARPPAEPHRHHPIDDVRVGDVIVDPANPKHGPAAVVELGRARGGGRALHVVRTDARRMVVRRHDFRSDPVVVAHLDVAAIATGRGHARRVAESVARLNVVMPPAPRPPASVRSLRPRRTPLEREQARDRARLYELDHGIDEEFNSVVALLRRRGHVEDAQLTASGRTLRRLFHVRGLLVAECLTNGLLDGLDPTEVATLGSVFLDERRAADLAVGTMPTRRLAERWDHIMKLAADLDREQAYIGLAIPAPPTATWARAIRQWMQGDDLGTASAAGGTPPGDLTRAIKQAADLLGQIASAAPHLSTTVEEAIERLLRGAVTAAAPRLS